MRMISKSTRFLALAAVAVSLVLPAQAEDAPAQPAVLLKVDVSKGDQFRYRQTTDVKSAMDMGGMPMNTAMHIVNEYTLSVLAVDENGASRFKIHYDRIHGHAEMPQMGRLEFDSEEDVSDENPMLAMMTKQFSMLAGKGFELTLSPQGTVESVEGLAAIMQDAMQSSGLGAMTGAPTPTDEDLKSQVGPLFQPLPAEAVKAGAVWTHESGGGGQFGLSVKQKTTFELASTDDAAVVLNGKLAFEAKTTDTDTDTDKDTAAASPMPKMDIEDGKGTSVTKLSRKDGLPLTSKSESTMQMSMANPMGADAGTIEMTNTTTVTLERVTSTPTTGDEEAK